MKDKLLLYSKLIFEDYFQNTGNLIIEDGKGIQQMQYQ